MSRIEELSTIKVETEWEIRKTLKKIHHANQVLLHLKRRLAEERRKYESADRELAELDGRYKVVKGGHDSLLTAGKRKPQESEVCKKLKSMSKNDLSKLIKCMEKEMGGENEKK